MKPSVYSPSGHHLFDVLDYLVDDLVGIIGLVEELPMEAGAPAFFHFYARSCNTGVFTRHKNFTISGGASSDRQAAVAKAVGEAVERYCSTIYDEEELPLTSHEEASFPCVEPSQFALYSPQQYAEPNFPYLPFNSSTCVRWTPSLDLLSNNVCYVPAAMVFLPYYFRKESGEHDILQPISTGLACHSSLENAAISAICEVIERDSFTITWQGLLARPHILIGSLSDQNRDLVERFERTGNTVTLLDITMDTLVPTILATLRNNSNLAPALVVAASSDLDPEQAVRKSLEELAHTRGLCQSLKLTMPPIEPGVGYENIKHQDDHIRFYCDHHNARLADFLFQSDERRSFQEIGSLTKVDHRLELDLLVQKINSLGHRVLLADITTQDIGQLGLSVVRAIIPGFHPLFMGHRFRALGGSRLWEVPKRLGYFRINSMAEDNPAPHPFP